MKEKNNKINDTNTTFKTPNNKILIEKKLVDVLMKKSILKIVDRAKHKTPISKLKNLVIKNRPIIPTIKFINVALR